MGKFFDMLFGDSETPSIPTPEIPPPPPSIDTAAVEQNRREQDDDNRLRRRGRAATILTGPEGAGLPQTATKTLLGE